MYLEYFFSVSISVQNWTSLNDPERVWCSKLKKVHLLAKMSTFIFSAEWILHFVHAFDKILLVENGRWGG